MKRRRNAGIPSKYLLVILTIFCIMLLFTSYVTGFSGGPLQLISSYIFVPMQRGLDYVGSSISISNEDAQTREELLAENEKLRQQVEDLSVQLNNTQASAGGTGNSPGTVSAGSVLYELRDHGRTGHRTGRQQLV